LIFKNIFIKKGTMFVHKKEKPHHHG